MTDQLPFYNKVLVALINLIGIWLTLMVFKNDPKKKINEIFLGMAFFMFMWVNFAYLSRLVGNKQPEMSLVLLKIAWFATPLLFIFLYLLVIYLLKKEKKYTLLSKSVLFLGFIIVPVTGLSDLVVKGIVFINGELTIVYGYSMFPFLITVLFFMCAPIYVLLNEQKKIKHRERARIQYLVLGIIIFYVANAVFNIFFPIVMGIIRFYWIGDYSAIFLLSFTAYAITKHNLMGIKTLIAQTLIVIITIVLLLDIFVLSEGIVMQLLKTGILITFLYFSSELLKSVRKEREARKKLQGANIKLAKANSDLKDLLEMKNEFLHITSHQLRTPLTALRGMLSMWQEGSFDALSPSKKKEMMKRIYVSSERLNNITNDMLDALELEGRSLKMKFEPVSLIEVIEETIGTLKQNFEKKGIYIKFDKPKEDFPKIQAEPDYIRQVFMNIIDNASKYTAKGGVTIDMKQSEKCIRVTVRDTGIGVPPKELGELFQKFKRAENALRESASGSGLGLFIAKKIVEIHRGKISIESEGENKGSIVKVCLPKKSLIIS